MILRGMGVVRSIWRNAMLEEFKKFAMRGNVIDLAVGVIIGAAFGKITDSLVKDVLLPPLGMLTGRIDFNQLYWQIGDGARYPTLDATRRRRSPWRPPRTLHQEWDSAHLRRSANRAD